MWDLSSFLFLQTASLYSNQIQLDPDEKLLRSVKNHQSSLNHYLCIHLNVWRFKHFLGVQKTAFLLFSMNFEFQNYEPISIYRVIHFVDLLCLCLLSFTLGHLTCCMVKKMNFVNYLVWN